MSEEVVLVELLAIHCLDHWVRVLTFQFKFLCVTTLARLAVRSWAIGLEGILVP